FVFFFAGLEMSSKLMCFTGQELMENVDVQDKLYAEIAEVDSQMEGGQVTYDALMSMKYLYQVVNEVLRKWPPSLSVDRECNKDIYYEVDGKIIKIKKGDCVFLSNCARSAGHKYFENPTKFAICSAQGQEPDLLHASGLSLLLKAPFPLILCPPVCKSILRRDFGFSSFHVTNLRLRVTNSVLCKLEYDLLNDL
ncbi:probable cytochrome P450 9f2, partial [Drosophila nasuta]|uniref:probable cytochrome P450 9f2 n=1 Tax=Drosophila nasuta TaxID=42062 RepID=UPI00295E46AB